VPNVAQKRCLPVCVLKTNRRFSANCAACSSVDFPETHRGVEFLTYATRELSIVLVNMAECNTNVCVDKPVWAEDLVCHLEPEKKKSCRHKAVPVATDNSKCSVGWPSDARSVPAPR
jgi:hypothetical protein